MRAVTPLPVALRSIWPSPNTQKWRLGRGAAGGVSSVRMAPYRKERSGSVRMADLAAGADHVHHRQRCRPQLSDWRSAEVETDARRRQDGVEGAAIADVAEDAAGAGNLDQCVERGGEGGHAVERDAGAAVR